MIHRPDFDARLQPGPAEWGRWAAEDQLARLIEEAYEQSGQELARRFGDRFIFFLDQLVEDEFTARA